MDNRARLIRAARSAFANEGYANASMDQFSSSVGLTRGALYYQFGGKEGLLKAVVEQIDAEIAVRLKESVREIEDDWERFRLGAHGFLHMALEPEIQRIMLRDAPAVLGNDADRGMHRTCQLEMIVMLERLMADGIIVRVDPEALTRLLSGALTDAALWIARSADPENAVKRALTAFDAILNGLRANEPGAEAPRP